MPIQHIVLGEMNTFLQDMYTSDSYTHLLQDFELVLLHGVAHDLSALLRDQRL